MPSTCTTSIPRLELCSEVLATQAVMMIGRELDVKIDEEIYYSDSKVVFGYIQNDLDLNFYGILSSSLRLHPRRYPSV